VDLGSIQDGVGLEWWLDVPVSLLKWQSFLGPENIQGTLCLVVIEGKDDLSGPCCLVTDKIEAAYLLGPVCLGSKHSLSACAGSRGNLEQAVC
jgi:hypothetical protein